ncbi:hypothetical protein IQ22_01730 [Pseudomonas duriflava]|uniref:Uncharacterized protein n=1 Tax=Pseudomonas duriflava TaxID=459528 RepID=A0A562QDI2_9PSED|nr:hypothetical protein [Pseudomonas duriflava]TWI54827.1 hypothetical protein IQ22_01730 [Pseudomonas duriflava]
MTKPDDYPEDVPTPDDIQSDQIPEHSKKENLDKIKYDSEDIIPPGVW